MVGIKGKSGIYKRNVFTKEHKKNLSKSKLNHIVSDKTRNK